METIVSRGKDVHEAISLGLELLNATRQEVEIEIIQQQSKRFMGLGQKQAVVKLTKQMESTNAPPHSHHSDSRNDFLKDIETLLEKDKLSIDEKESEKEDKAELLAGKAWVENGILYCESSPSHFPLVTLSEGIELYKNNEKVSEKTTILSQSDIYELKPAIIEKKTFWKVKLDTQKLKVEVEVHPGYESTWVIEDCKPDHHIKIKGREKREARNTLQYSDLMASLENLRVIHGFRQEEMMKAAQTEVSGTFVIAEGIRAQEGQDGWVEFVVEMADQNIGPRMSGDGKVDYREIKTFSTVRPGQVVATAHPPIPGKMGYTVTNEPLPARQTKPAVLRAGNGVALVGESFVATDAGRPQVEKRGRMVKVSILPKLLHQGNVNLESGNIRFKGDVEIQGEVEKGMMVEAEGDVMIHRAINAASITASGTVISYGSVLGSEISAGKYNLLVAELGIMIESLQKDVEKIIAFIGQLTLSPAFKSSDFARGGLQPLIRILLEKKFKGFPAQAKKYIEASRKGELFLNDEEWKQVSVSLTQLFLSVNKEVVTLEMIQELSYRMKALHKLSLTPAELDSFITIPNALNSRIYCSGNILILGQGSINSKVHAEGKLKVSGVIRGGEVFGRLGAEVNEAGAESGTPTLVTVPAGQTIKINKALEGTKIVIGHHRYTFNQTSYNIRARLAQDGSLLLS
ncbi:DUF342 domain-containing protein [Rossellomorea vietnamensis]|uniref:DUF342 domain-containing protein n=1 Tax=Rossellomorea vietnamensis TaxID=218284 RepID=A0A5D4MBI6_9BACI|nr:flagellar assembly protein A [Rossellomorea vietnamensis]TYR98848.1 DUF342 domain-containing protein [Rossellomorea vietnamensis]